MNCNRCGNPVDPNSSYCNTCGNQIIQPTVVPQTNNTVVPQVDNTVVPTVVPQKNNSAPIVAIILVMVLFIGVGCAGVVLLKQTKGTVIERNVTQNVVYNETTNKTNVTKQTEDIVSTTKPNGWGTTTQKVDIIDESSVYKINGFNIKVPAGYSATYKDDMLTVVNNSNGQFYMLSVVINNLSQVDWNNYTTYMRNNGINVSNLARTQVGNHEAYTLTMSSNGESLYAFYIQVKAGNILYIVFPLGTSYEYMQSIIFESIGE